MYGKSKVLCAFFVVLAVGACMQRGPSVVQSTTPSVTYQYDGSQRQFLETSRHADEFCAGYSRAARLDETYRSGANHFAVYSCH